MEMELRSGRRLSPRQGAARRVRAWRGPPERGDGRAVDGLTALPNALLLLILARLGSTAEAARTSTVASRFAQLWPDLHVLVFRGVDPDTLGALLARATHLQLSRLEIQVPRPLRGLPASQISSLLRAAEEHKPEDLVVDVGGGDDDGVPFELPYFTRATSIDLQIWNRVFTLPPAGEFAKLERLSLSLCCVDPKEFLPRCPCLRVLNVDCNWLQNVVEVHSDSLQEIVLKDVPLPVGDRTPRRVDIVAPMLKRFRLQSYGHSEMMASFSAPAPLVETLSFKYCSASSRAIGVARELRLLSLTTAMEWRHRYGELNPVPVRVLSLVILSSDCLSDANRSFAEEIARLPVSNFSILKLDLRTMRHVFGTLVFDFLKTLNAIQRLELVLLLPLGGKEEGPKRYVNYDPDHWRNEHILLLHLEEIEIERLNATEHDIDFLEVLFTSAPKLKSVRIQLAAWVSQGDLRYKELCKVFWANPSVNVYVNGVLEDGGENLPPGPPRRSDRLRAMRHHSA